MDRLFEATARNDADQKLELMSTIIVNIERELLRGLALRSSG